MVKAEKQSLTEKILLLIADFIDFHQQPVTLKAFNYKMMGLARYRPVRTWLERYFRSQKKQNVYSTIYRLKKQGCLKIKTSKEGKGYILTSKGEEMVLKIKIRNFKKKHDPSGYWLMIIFDIPEKRRKDRGFLRFYLHELGFQKLQQSVWISPHDVFKELKEIVRNLKLKSYIKFLKVKELGEF